MKNSDLIKEVEKEIKRLDADAANEIATRRTCYSEDCGYKSATMTAAIRLASVAYHAFPSHDEWKPWYYQQCECPLTKAAYNAKHFPNTVLVIEHGTAAITPAIAELLGQAPITIGTTREGQLAA